MLGSHFFVLFDGVGLFVKVLGGSVFFRFFLGGLLCCFLFIRVPYVYGGVGFSFFLVLMILPLFFVLSVRRMVRDVGSFVGSFIPEGCPLLMSPFVCLIELGSYCVRPMVLVFRPFVKLTIGALFGHVLCGWCIGSLMFVVFWVFLFFYEVFVAIIHWYIVSEILAFSENH